MKSTNENYLNDVLTTSFTDDFLLLMLKNLQFRKIEVEVDIETIRKEIQKRRLTC